MITAHQVSKSFVTQDGDRVEALKDVTLDVAEGHIAALLGPSGCGKSTLLNIFAGLDDPTSGSVTVAGEPPRAHRDVGMMFQKASLFPWRTVRENVLMPAELLRLPKAEARERADELLGMVGLTEWASRYPWQLSGGMQQRVALARVLLADPRILLLDEPFGALDEMNRENLDLEMSRIVETTGKTAVMVTHSVYEAVLLADEVFVLTDRPGQLAGVVQVTLPRPRTLEETGTELFADKVAETRDHLRVGRSSEVTA